MLTAEHNQLLQADDNIGPGIETHIKCRWLEGAISTINDDLDRQIRSNLSWFEKGSLLKIVPRVAKVVSTTLLIELPERGMLNRCKITTLVGVAPLNRYSGLYAEDGRCVVWPG